MQFLIPEVNMFCTNLHLREHTFPRKLATGAGALLIAFNALAADLPAKPMKMEEPMAGQMKKEGMKKGDVKKAAKKKEQVMKPMLEKEEKAMSRSGRAK